MTTIDATHHSYEPVASYVAPHLQGPTGGTRG